MSSELLFKGSVQGAKGEEVVASPGPTRTLGLGFKVGAQKGDSGVVYTENVMI